jgi:signal transduction histidine kinase
VGTVVEGQPRANCLVPETMHTFAAERILQLDQLLINLVNNAVDAELATGGGVRVRRSRLHTKDPTSSSEERMIDRIIKAIQRCKPFALSIFLTYVLSSSIGILEDGTLLPRVGWWCVTSHSPQRSRAITMLQRAYSGCAPSRTTVNPNER